MTHTQKTLIADLDALKIDRHGLLVVHSSYKAAGPVEGGPEAVLDALSDYMAEGLLVLPTHSWTGQNLKDDLYDPLTEPSCVGLLTNLFLKRPGVVRSLHPTHSVAVLGPGAEDFAAGEEHSETPCPPTGCWGKLYGRDAEILFLGCSLNKNTFLHSIEEHCRIPNRLREEPRMIRVLPPGGEPYSVALRGHYSTHGDVSEHYGKLFPLFLEKGIARRGLIGNAESVVCRARPMGDLVMQLLEKDPDLFADGRLP